MIKLLTTLLLTFTFAIPAFVQNYEPQILILTPNEFHYEKSFEKAVKSRNKEIAQSVDYEEQNTYINSGELKGQPENIQQIIRSEINFMKDLDFSKDVSLTAERYLSYRFYERFTNLLILLSDKKSDGSLLSFLKITETEKMQYVLNFSKIELFKKGRVQHARITVQLYDNETQSIVINDQYVGDWTNPGFEFACEEKTIDCTVNNALSGAMRDVIAVVAANSPTIKRDRELAQQRYDELISNYLSKPNDTDFLKQIIEQPDSNIVLKDQFQILIDPTRTKFLAFFLEEVSANDFKSMKDKRNDKSINIETSSNLNDAAFFADMPQKYAYIVKGVKYEGKWYYEKGNVTYFEAENLENGQQKYFYNLAKWGFFKEDATEFNPEFWESRFYEKVERSVISQKDEIDEIKLSIESSNSPDDKLIYQEMIEDYYEKDLKNEEYFGLYALVANQLKRDKVKEIEGFSAYFTTDLLPNFYTEYCKENHINAFIKMNGAQLRIIFPSDKSVILSPVVFDYGKDRKELNFFVLIPNDDASYAIYKWNYFTPIKPQYSSMYGGDINEQLNKITKWNFSFNTLEDKDFWNNYVLLKVDGEYKYLKKVN